MERESKPEQGARISWQSSIAGRSLRKKRSTGGQPPHEVMAEKHRRSVTEEAEHRWATATRNIRWGNLHHCSKQRLHATFQKMNQNQNQAVLRRENE
jgi:hypothetical protein